MDMKVCPGRAAVSFARPLAEGEPASEVEFEARVCSLSPLGFKMKNTQQDGKQSAIRTRHAVCDCHQHTAQIPEQQAIL